MWWRWVVLTIRSQASSSDRRDAQRWGVDRGFEDSERQWHDTSPVTIESILDAMEATSPGPAPTSVLTLRLDRAVSRVPTGQLTLEDGATLRVGGPLPPGIPPGYHHLESDDGPALTVIASPGYCPLPAEPSWGFTAQLYGTRSASSWGFGDLGDLKRLGEWSAGLGAGFIVVNPLHASVPTFPQQPSPYFAGSRCFLNPLYLAVEQIPGVAGDLAELAMAGRALNAERLVDRDRVWQLKSAALEATFLTFAGHPEFDAYVMSRGEALQGFATFSALAEVHGGAWQLWPAELRHPASGAVRDFAASATGSVRVRYHTWLQWLLDRQLAAAATDFTVVSDLALGVDPGGPDAWLWQETFVSGMRVGAPPDRFNTRGQNWALPPHDPWRLRAAGYQPWIESLRGVLRHSGGIRLDHVMGLFRMFWIPVEGTPADGGYVRYPHEDLLNIVALEAHRAGAFVVGEDLGTVESGVRQSLTGRNLLSYKVWWFQPDRPASWPTKALGSVSTHDLPTVAGVLSGSDLAAQRQLGMEPNEAASARLREKLVTRTASNETTPAVEVIDRVFAELGDAPCVLLTASLDDAAAVEERPNMPGTVDEWPNWRLALPMSLEDLEGAELPRRIAAHLGRGSAQLGTSSDEPGGSP